MKAQKFRTREEVLADFARKGISIRDGRRAKAYLMVASGVFFPAG
jgi:hypothetical protein